MGDNRIEDDEKYGLIKGSIKAVLGGAELEKIVVQLLSNRAMSDSIDPVRCLEISDSRNSFPYAISLPGTMPVDVDYPQLSILVIEGFLTTDRLIDGTKHKVLLINRLRLKESGYAVSGVIGHLTPLDITINEPNASPSNRSMVGVASTGQKFRLVVEVAPVLIERFGLNEYKTIVGAARQLPGIITILRTLSPDTGIHDFIVEALNSKALIAGREAIQLAQRFVSIRKEARAHFERHPRDADVVIGKTEARLPDRVRVLVKEDLRNFSVVGITGDVPAACDFIRAQIEGLEVALTSPLAPLANLTGMSLNCLANGHGSDSSSHCAAVAQADTEISQHRPASRPASLPVSSQATSQDSRFSGLPVQPTPSALNPPQPRPSVPQGPTIKKTVRVPVKHVRYFMSNHQYLLNFIQEATGAEIVPGAPDGGDSVLFHVQGAADGVQGAVEQITAELRRVDVSDNRNAPPVIQPDAKFNKEPKSSDRGIPAVVPGNRCPTALNGSVSARLPERLPQSASNGSALSVESIFEQSGPSIDQTHPNPAPGGRSLRDILGVGDVSEASALLPESGEISSQNSISTGENETSVVAIPLKLVYFYTVDGEALLNTIRTSSGAEIVSGVIQGSVRLYNVSGGAKNVEKAVKSVATHMRRLEREQTTGSVSSGSVSGSLVNLTSSGKILRKEIRLPAGLHVYFQEKGCRLLNEIRTTSGAKIEIKAVDGASRVYLATGTAEQVEHAVKLVNAAVRRLNDANSERSLGGSAVGQARSDDASQQPARAPRSHPTGRPDPTPALSAYVETVTVPAALMGYAVGRQGANITLARQCPGIHKIVVDNPACSFSIRGEDVASVKKARGLLEYREEVMQVPDSMVGRIIGKQGVMLKDIIAKSGVSRMVKLEDGTFVMMGLADQIAAARALVEAILKSQETEQSDAMELHQQLRALRAITQARRAARVVSPQNTAENRLNANLDSVNAVEPRSSGESDKWVEPPVDYKNDGCLLV